jgi:hypothetical protein
MGVVIRIRPEDIPPPYEKAPMRNLTSAFAFYVDEYTPMFPGCQHFFENFIL